MIQNLKRDNFGYMLINLTTYPGLHTSILTGLLVSTLVPYGIFSTQGSYHSLIHNSPMISLHMKFKIHPVVYRSVVYIVWPPTTSPISSTTSHLLAHWTPDLPLPLCFQNSLCAVNLRAFALFPLPGMPFSKPSHVSHPLPPGLHSRVSPI